MSVPARAFLLGICLIFAPAITLAQGGRICAFSDPSATSCNLTDDAPGLFTVYIAHSDPAGVTASRFAAPKPGCMVGATWLEDQSFFPAFLGDSQSGFSAGYGACRTDDVVVLAIHYSAAGLTTPDCAYQVVPARGFFEIEATDCNNQVVTGTGGTAFINSNLACDCTVVPGQPTLAVSPAVLHFDKYETVKEFNITNAGGGVLNWQASVNRMWLLEPYVGTGDGSVQVTIDRFRDRVTNDVIAIESNGGSQTVSVSIDLREFYVMPRVLDFGEAESRIVITIRQTYFDYWNVPMDWQVVESIPWLRIRPMEGTAGHGAENAGRAEVLVDRSNLAPGTYTATFDVLGQRNQWEVFEPETVTARVVVNSSHATPVEQTTWGRVKALYGEDS